MNQHQNSIDGQPYGIEQRIGFLEIALDALGLKFSDIEKHLLLPGETNIDCPNLLGRINQCKSDLRKNINVLERMISGLDAMIAIHSSMNNNEICSKVSDHQ
ncbi:MAG: hypothetical protein KJS79_11965 [Rhodospirillales bacterium]|nr:hypothetical protein [Rhodospirillales bacterium]